MTATSSRFCHFVDLAVVLGSALAPRPPPMRAELGRRNTQAAPLLEALEPGATMSPRSGEDNRLTTLNNGAVPVTCGQENTALMQKMLISWFRGCSHHTGEP
ncbi:hypothetical protein NDU88_002596 [Pleurodeles waltl]|uniref:Secreted protein n=1 Tax=Pleurodeles waltl TaxID=8319 RepID=A0AAV7KZE1_PLEWA|nr:hypothetical protein NDU88_002596 [Pleurodeles waltl]